MILLISKSRREAISGGFCLTHTLEHDKAQQQAHVNTDHMAQLRAIKEKHVASTAMQRIAKAH